MHYLVFRCRNLSLRTTRRCESNTSTTCSLETTRLTNTTSSVHQLSSIMQTILQSTLATSTNRNYHSVFNAYISFCRSQNLLALPLQEFNLMLFVTNLSLHTSYSNIKLHISAVKHFNIYIMATITSYHHYLDYIC